MLTCDHVTHLCVGTLAITSPTGTAYTNGMIAIQIAAMPGNNPPSEVDIRIGGTVLTTVQQPFSYTWDTRNTPEGTYQVDAVATVGGTTITSAPVTIVVDRSAPQISMRTPLQNATNIALSDPIQIVFSEALDPSTVSNGAITLTSQGSTLTTTASLASDGRTIDVALGAHSALSFPATITTGVNAGIKDLAGNPVGSIASWSWTAPLWVQLPSLPAQYESLALDSTGRAYVAYVSPGTSTSTLSVARYAAGATWDFGLGPVTSDSVTAAAIAMGQDDAPVVVWSADHVRAARWSGTTWDPLGAAIEAVVPAVNSVDVTSIVVGPGNVPVVGWAGTQVGSPFGYVATWSGSAWQALPPDAAAGNGGPVLQVDNNGGVAGFFGGGIGSGPSIESYQSGAWGTLYGSNTLLPGLAFDSQNRPVIITHDTESNLEVIHVQVIGASGPPTDLTPSLPTGSAGVLQGLGRVALDQAGNPIVLWGQQNAQSNERLFVARFNGTAWDTTFGTLTGVAGNTGAATGASLGIDAAGRPTVSWSEEETGTGIVAVYTWKSNY
jgi:hypothetical protein